MPWCTRSLNSCWNTCCRKRMLLKQQLLTYPRHVALGHFKYQNIGNMVLPRSNKPTCIWNCYTQNSAKIDIACRHSISLARRGRSQIPNTEREKTNPIIDATFRGSLVFTDTKLWSEVVRCRCKRELIVIKWTQNRLQPKSSLSFPSWNVVTNLWIKSSGVASRVNESYWAEMFYCTCNTVQGGRFNVIIWKIQMKAIKHFPLPVFTESGSVMGFWPLLLKMVNWDQLRPSRSYKIMF